MIEVRSVLELHTMIVQGYILTYSKTWLNKSKDIIYKSYYMQTLPGEIKYLQKY